MPLFPTTERVAQAASAQGAPTPERLLEVDHVSLSYRDGTHALGDVTFAVCREEFVSVVGPSGCGKSTLLGLASGLLRPTAGTVATLTDRVGYIFQDATLLPWRTVAANVELLAELNGVSRAERSELADRALALVGLSEFKHSYPGRLSGGMRMRASLARSLTISPSLFLFDEPFGALDEITREALNDQLLELFVANRFAALFVTHSVSEAVFLSTRVVVMSARPGRILADIAVPFPYPRAPELRFTAQFGSIASHVSAALRRGESA